MTNSMLAAVHRAVHATPEETGATAPETGKERTMDPNAQTTTQQPAAAAPPATSNAAASPAAAGADDAKGRIKAILDAPEAKGREAMAKHLAFETDQTAEAAIALLKVAPTASEASKPDAAAYAAERQAAAPLAAPGGPSSDQPTAKAGWGKVSGRINGRA